jgi:hypothetical protein
MARQSDDQDQCVFKRLYEFCFFYLNLSQLNVFRDRFDNGRWKQLQKFSMGIFPIFNLIFSLHATLRHRNNIDGLSLGFNSALIVGQMFCKVIELFVHRKAHRELIEIVQRDTENLMNDPIYCDMGIKYFNYARKCLLLYAFTLCVSLVGMILSPLLVVMASNKLILAVNIEIFFTNNTEPIGWIINLCYGIFYATQTALFLIGYDSIFYIYIIYIELRFKMLERMLNKIGDFIGAYDTNEKQHVLVVNCSKLHAEII